MLLAEGASHDRFTLPSAFAVAVKFCTGLKYGTSVVVVVGAAGSTRVNQESGTGVHALSTKYSNLTCAPPPFS